MNARQVWKELIMFGMSLPGESSSYPVVNFENIADSLRWWAKLCEINSWNQWWLKNKSWNERKELYKKKNSKKTGIRLRLIKNAGLVSQNAISSSATLISYSFSYQQSFILFHYSYNISWLIIHNSKWNGIWEIR